MIETPVPTDLDTCWSVRCRCGVGAGPDAIAGVINFITKQNFEPSVSIARNFYIDSMYMHPLATTPVPFRRWQQPANGTNFAIKALLGYFSTPRSAG